MDRTLRTSSKASPTGASHSSSQSFSVDSSAVRPIPSTESVEAAKVIYANQTATPPQQQQPQRPSAPPRATSSNSAAAAAAAAMSGTTVTVGQRQPGDYGRYGGYDQQQQEDSYGQHGGQAQQRKYNPADYAAVGAGYASQSAAQARPPVQQTPVQQQPPPQQSYQPPVPKQEQAVAPRQSSAGIASQRQQMPSATDSGTGQRIGLDHFNFLAVLGKGNFGKVMLAETKRSRKLYAIKVLKKEFIIEHDEVESMRSEKRVFLVANKERHPFLANLHACFQTETRVYFVMEYVSGGDLMLHIQRGQFGTKRAQFYAAEVCLALKYFHENGVIYRDLKLDNIMLNLDGHIKVADYGLCKEDMWYGSNTSTFCGTPEFMAPEVSELETLEMGLY